MEDGVSTRLVPWQHDKEYYVRLNCYYILQHTYAYDRRRGKRTAQNRRLVLLDGSKRR